LTAPISDVDSVGGVGRACSVAADGRRAARALGLWCARLTLSEPEFQVLWCLRNCEAGGFDQTMLARSLAYSAAQVSSTVERLRVRGWIAQQSPGGDRRRNLWHLSKAGREVVVEMLRTAHDLRWEIQSVTERPPLSSSGREAAA
jgi:DNA-binding MarR family transcriptional regulator